MVNVTGDPNLKNVGQKEGIQMWRINKFQLEEVPKTEWGMFFEGDSYIILKTAYNAESWDVHFWLGKTCSIDEMGTAAIKAVEIDNSLGGLPTQYREVQGHESALFLSYFKNGIRYLTGGYESGFNKVEGKTANFKPKLYHCKGKRNVRCMQVDLSLASLNLGDVFLLDVGTEIFVWMPPESGRLERIRGMERAKNIVDTERANLCKVTVLDDDWDKNTDFWKRFGGRQNISKISKAVDDDENFWRTTKDQVALWRICDASGEATVKQIAQGDQVKQKLLDSKDAFVLDAVNGGIFVWVGKGCTMEERSKAFKWGQTYITHRKLPAWTAVTRVLETAEPQLFSQWFADWQGAKKKGEFTPRLFQCSNETGKLVVEEIADFNQADLDGDDVMILDAVNTVYVWVGAGANAEEKKHAEQTAKDYIANGAVKRHAKTVIDTVFQGKETPTFKKFFPKWDDKLFQGQRSVANMRKLLFK